SFQSGPYGFLPVSIQKYRVSISTSRGRLKKKTGFTASLLRSFPPRRRGVDVAESTYMLYSLQLQIQHTGDRRVSVAVSEPGSMKPDRASRTHCSHSAYGKLAIPPPLALSLALG